MHKLNELRLLAGIVIDPKLEKTQRIDEQRTVPMKRGDLRPKDTKHMGKRVRQLEIAIGFIKKAINALERAPAVDFSGDIPYYLGELEDLLSSEGGQAGLETLLKIYRKEHEKQNKRSGVIAEGKDDKTTKKSKEQKEAEDRAAEEDRQKHSVKEDEELEEMHGRTERMLKAMGEDPEKHKREEQAKKEAKKKAKEAKKVEESEDMKLGDVKEGSAYPGCENEEEDDTYAKDIKGKKVKNYPGREKCQGNKGNKTAKGMAESHVDTDKDKKVKDKSGKIWKVLSSGKGEGEDEVYHLECPNTGKKATKKASEIVNENAKTIMASDYEFKHVYGAKDYPHKLKKRPSQKDKYDQYDVGDTGKVLVHVSDKKKTTEGVDYYSDDSYPESHEGDDTGVRNTVGKEQYYPVGDKDESPQQTKDGMHEPYYSEQDQTKCDLENKIKVPSSILQSLQKEIDQAKAEADKIDVRDKEGALFHRDMAKAFGDLQTHIKKGTVYDMKQAQVYFQSLKSPMMYKVPADVVKFLAHGGQPRSLKAHYQEVKGFPKTGAQNKLR